MQQSLYRTLSGCEIHAVFGNIKFGDIQMIKYTSSRQRAPVYTLGSPNARAMARGVRSINGALIFSHLSSASIVDQLAETGARVFLSNDELANYISDDNRRADRSTDTFKTEIKDALDARQKGATLADTGFISDTGDTFNAFNVGESIFKSSNFGESVAPYLADQLPPFDITLVGIPEVSGKEVAEDPNYMPQSLIIRGVEFTSEASGTSIQDMVIEKQMAFIARSIHEWASPKA